MRLTTFLVPWLAGCALTSKATPTELRYFSPETVTTHPADARTSDPPRLRVGRITSTANLRYRIVHRESPVETGEYETLRWADTPDVFVRRSLVDALFHGRLEQATGGPDPTLDVEVVVFEQVRGERVHGGRVELRYQLRDGRSVLASDVVTVERHARDSGIDADIVAIGAAMDTATAQIASAVAARLSLPPEPPVPP
jgi:ABC-type uncharacterized transport system auxiliary subunit